MGYHEAANQIEFLGSGFLFEYLDDSFYIFTAAHVIHSFVDEVLPRRSNTLWDADDELTDLEARSAKVVASGAIRVHLEPTPGHVVELPLFLVAMGLDPRAHDIAVLRADISKHPNPGEQALLTIELEPAHDGEIVIGVGFASRPDTPDSFDLSQSSRSREWRAATVIRAGRVLETTRKGEGARGGLPLLRTSIPTLGRMSGGALLRLHEIDRGVQLAGTVRHQTLSVIGVISRGNPGGAFLAYSQNPEGETWMSPVSSALELVAYGGPPPTTLRTLVADGVVIEFADVMKRLKKSAPQSVSEQGDTALYLRTRG